VVVQLAEYRLMNARDARLIVYLSQLKLNIRHVQDFVIILLFF